MSPLDRAEQKLSELRAKAKPNAALIGKVEARVRMLKDLEVTKQSMLIAADRVIKGAAAIAPKWKRERKEARDAERRAKRNKSERAKHENAREMGKRQGYAPDTGNLESLPVNRRHDILEHMLGQRMINEAEKAAGDHFIFLCQSAEMIGFRSTGDSDRVSGAGPRSGPGDVALHAKDELERVERHLGVTGFRILYETLHRGKTLAQIASWLTSGSMNGEASKRDRLYVGARVREILESLSHMRAATGAPRKDGSKPLVWKSDDAQPSDRPDLREPSSS